MTTPDSERERQRLAELYAGMSDGELEAIAEDSAELTDVARDVLKRELARRAVDVPVQEPGVPSDGPADSAAKLVTVDQFRDLPEALLAKATLESAGIDCFLSNANMVRLDWWYSNVVGGIRLNVREEDAEAATQLLTAPIPETFEVAGVGEYRQPQCPNCQSVDVSFHGLNRPISYATMAIGVPIPVSSKDWECHSCGQWWQDDTDR